MRHYIIITNALLLPMRCYYQCAIITNATITTTLLLIIVKRGVKEEGVEREVEGVDEEVRVEVEV
jgi:hypothetical protein